MVGQKHRLKRNLAVVCFGAAVVLSGCGESEQTTPSSSEEVEEVEEVAGNAATEEKSKIPAVKEGTLEDYPDQSVGAAFDSYFSQPEWNDASVKEGKKLVEFTGDFVYEQENMTASIQFLVDENDDFEIEEVSYNGVPQNEVNTTSLFTSIFEEESIEEIEEEPEVAEEATESEPAEVPETTGVGTPFPLGTHLNELRNYYGQSTYDDYFMGGRVVVFNDADGYVLDDAETVVGFFLSNPSIPVFGTYVGMTPSEIASILSEPAETFFDESETQSYVTYYTIENLKVSYFSETEQGPTTSVLIMGIQ